MAKNLRRQKMQLLPCAFLVSRHGIFKIHLSQCVFWCFDVVYFLHMFGAFAMRFLLKSVFFTRLAPVSRPGVFFYALGTCVLCRCIYFTRVWKSDLHVTASVFSYPHIVHFFWKVHFWTAPVETKIRFLLQVYFGSTCFPKVKRTLNCFKIVRVSTGFGEFKAKVPCKHFGEESICSIMFFFQSEFICSFQHHPVMQSSLVPIAH